MSCSYPSPSPTPNGFTYLIAAVAISTYNLYKTHITKK